MQQQNRTKVLILSIIARYNKKEEDNVGSVDTATKAMMRKNEFFADAVNLAVFGGRPVVHPEDLRELDTAEIAIPAGTAKYNDKKDFLQKFRDVLKEAVIKTDDRVTYVLIGVENQKSIHYAMPVKNLLYDAAQYSRQVEAAAQEHRKKKDWNANRRNQEFLSGFRKDDKLIPVVTIVVYYGKEKWDAPLSLRDMYDDMPPEVLALTPDYKYVLIEPETMNTEELEKAYSDLQQVLKFINVSSDKKAMADLVSTDERFRSLDRDAAITIRETTGAKFVIPQEEGGVNVCKAIRDMQDDARKEGMEQGQEKLTQLFQFLQTRGLPNDAMRIMSDKNFREEMLKKYKNQIG